MLPPTRRHEAWTADGEEGPSGQGPPGRAALAARCAWDVVNSRPDTAVLTRGGRGPVYRSRYSDTGGMVLNVNGPGVIKFDHE